MIPLFEAVVGSSMKLWIRSSDIDVRAFCVDPESLWIFPSNKAEWRPNHKERDYDWWELWYAIRQIIRWDNSSPLLLSCLFSTEFKSITDEWKELIDNKHKLIWPNIIKWTIKFCDRKIQQSKRKNQKYHAGKYVYYAISDIQEQIDILTHWKPTYPMNNNLQLMLSLKKNDDDLGKWYLEYDKIKSILLGIQIKNNVDLDRLNDFVKRCKIKYSYLYKQK